MGKCALDRKKDRERSFQALEVKGSINKDKKREMHYIWGGTKYSL